MNLYEAILRRRSIRKYKEDKISEQLLQKIKLFIGRAVPLYNEIGVKMEILDNTAGDVRIKGIWKVEAPYYLVCFSEEKDGAERNAGYLLEQIVLYMVSKGVGSCYLGGTKAPVRGPEGMSQLITVAFGYPKGLLFRDPDTAKRMPLKDLCVFKEEAGEAVKAVLKAARLSPSALNSQPWRFLVYQNRICIFACREFFPSAQLAAMREISMGIMMSHLVLAAEEMWMDACVETEEQMEKRVYKGGEYTATVRFEPL